MHTPPERLEAALADRYRIERELGAGGMATVYLAHDLKHERDVALKVLRPELGVVLGVERFLAEIKITARLDHPHILTLIDSGAVDGFLYYVMPFARGESLRDRLNRERQLSVEEALSITSQVASALDYAHRQGVIHRDIKPENILMQEGEAMLTDFGIALAVKEAGGNRLTETGLSLGTPQYMSPEQATGDRVLDARSDVYSLAAVLYEMLAGEPPVTGPNAQAMIAKLMVERPTSLRVVRDTVSEGLDAVVAKALAKAPADRFTGTAEFAKALATSALTTSALAVASPTKTRARRRSALIVGAVALVAAVIGYLALQRPQARTSASSPFATAIPTKLTTTGSATNGIPSPDGSQLAYSEVRCDAAAGCRAELLIRETSGEGVSTIVSKIGHIVTPVSWSPDGRWVLFSDTDESGGDESGFYVVSQRGGEPRRIGRSSNTRFPTMDFVASDTLVATDADGPDHWLRRLDVGSGQVVDSLPLPLQGTILGLAASPDGRRLLVTSVRSLTPDSATLHLVSRAAEVTDSIRIGFAFDGSSFAGALWSGPRAIIIATTINGQSGLVATRRRLDNRGRFMGRADTLTVIPDGRVDLSGMSSDGSRLFYSQTQLGELAFWTATRSGPRAPFAMGRKVAGSTGGLIVRLSPGGRWIFLSNALGALRTRARVEVEAFDTGERHVVESSLSSFMDFAFLPDEDSLILATQGLLTGPLVFNSYPLKGGSSVRWGSFDRISISGGIDLGSISDGRVATHVEGRSIRVFSPSGDIRDFPFPDSLGTVGFSRPSPASPEVAVGSLALGDEGDELTIARCNLLDGRCKLLARSRGLLPSAPGSAVWSDDGWIRLPLTSVGGSASMYRVSAEGGEFERETVLGLMPGSSIAGMSRDGRRALVSVQSATFDLWVLRAGPPR